MVRRGIEDWTEFIFFSSVLRMIVDSIIDNSLILPTKIFQGMVLNVKSKE